MKITIASLADISKAANEFIQHLDYHTVFAFRGDMGAGKTTFITAICQQLGVVDVITSPTFAIVNEYKTITGELIYHFDFYRIKDIEEAYDFGCDDYFLTGSLCFIEWGERIEELLPHDVVNVYITALEDGSREVVMGQ